MERSEIVKVCKTCKYRDFNPERGLLCSFTNEFGQFESECDKYEKDETVKEVKKEVLPEKKKIGKSERDNVLAFIGIIILSAAISFFIANSNFLYRGDSIGNIVIFILSFFTLSIIGYRLIMPGKIAIFNSKSVSGFFALLASVLMLTISALTVANDRRFLEFGVMVLIVSLYNLTFIFYSKFWEESYTNEWNPILAIISLVLNTLIFGSIIFYLILHNSPHQRMDKEDFLALLTFTSVMISIFGYTILIMRKEIDFKNLFK